ncbi:MAG TPA: HNH endonuclease [Noviherbaspirillum sp.]|nr:HNH endonuclease [Noviherbaspirillum sp.]
MAFDPGLKLGEVIDNKRLCATFGCGPQGGMRRSTRTGSLVIVSNHVDSIYDDRWVDDVLHYTGMGRKGNQSLTFMQNLTLAESNTNDVSVFLFEVFQDGEYTYRGQVRLVGSPYEELQPDEDGIERSVWVFPVKPTASAPVALPKTKLDEIYRRKERQARKLSDEELRRRAAHAHAKPGRRITSTNQIERSPWVAEYSRRRAAGKCDLCEHPAPFQSKVGRPYLENHHIEWLSRGGADTIANSVALCPNCHRRMHVLDLPEDRKRLLAVNAARETNTSDK